MATLAHKIDDALEKHYIAMGRTDYYDESGTGKFYDWMEENGWDMENQDEWLEAIEEDLNEDYDDPEETMFYDFIEEMDFPLSDDIKDDSDRFEAMRDILKNIVKAPPIEAMRDATYKAPPIELSISEEKVQEIGDIVYKKQIGWLGDMWVFEQTFFYWLVVGFMNNIPLLTWLVDAYTMEKTKNYLKNATDPFNVSVWAEDHSNKFMKNIRNKNESFRDTLERAMKSYLDRFFPRLTYCSSFKINDDIEEIVHYVSAVPYFLSRVMNNDDQMNTPFSVDICVAVRGVQYDDTYLDDDDDDDDDEDDDDDDGDYED
eukprot:895988_1